MNYRRKIVGRASQVSESLEETYAKANKHSDVVRYSGQYRISYGWRLECGHTLHGAAGHGKKAVNCHFCQWLESGDADFGRYASENLTEWTALNE